MSRGQRNADHLNVAIKSYLEKHGLGENPGWEIRRSDTGGFGVFVTRDFDVGEVIFRDRPCIIGPRCMPDYPKVCVVCFSYNNLHACERGCGLPLCSSLCQNGPGHLRECKLVRQNTIIPNEKVIYENFTPLRSLFLEKDEKELISCLIAHDREEHGREIDQLKTRLGFQFDDDEEEFLRFVCRVLDANAFEVALGEEIRQSSVRGLYPLGSLANHSCVPNTLHVFNSQRQMITKASVFIPKNSEIFHSYTRTIWGTSTRLFHLHQTKHFVCKCPRCQDPTEFGTFIGSVLCKGCRGLLSPLNPFKVYAKWQCKDCGEVVSGREVGRITSMVGSVLRSIEGNDYEFMLRFLNGKLMSVVPENNEVAVELKYKIGWVLGHKPGYRWEELSLEQLEIKRQICDDLLNLLEHLRCGQNKMRGLLLYELFCCHRQMAINKSSKQNVAMPEELNSLLKEAATILRYDVTAPKEIKQSWND